MLPFELSISFNIFSFSLKSVDKLPVIFKIVKSGFFFCWTSKLKIFANLDWFHLDKLPRWLQLFLLFEGKNRESSFWFFLLLFDSFRFLNLRIRQTMSEKRGIDHFVENHFIKSHKVDQKNQWLIALFIGTYGILPMDTKVCGGLG